MKKPKLYKLPKDVQAMWTRYQGLVELRDLYVTVRWFGYKLAARASAEAERSRTDFWAAVYDIHPVLREKYKVSYDIYKGFVTVLEEKEPVA